jgi:HD superfamily phosphohydrolase YqeK
VEVLTSIGLVRYFVMVVIDLKTRRVQIAGVVHDLCGRWVEQIARNLTDPLHGFLKDALWWPKIRCTAHAALEYR